MRVQSTVGGAVGTVASSSSLASGAKVSGAAALSLVTQVLDVAMFIFVCDAGLVH